MVSTGNIQIFIGDLKYNEDSHKFVDTYERSIVCTSNLFDKRIPFIDLDYLNLSKEEVTWIVNNSKVPLLITTLYPTKIDKKIPVQIHYLSNQITENDGIFDLVKQVFHEKDRTKLYDTLMNTKVSLFAINNWIQSNPTPGNFSQLMILDKYIGKVEEEVWISLLCELITTGPLYVNYRFKKAQTVS